MRGLLEPLPIGPSGAAMRLTELRRRTHGLSVLAGVLVAAGAGAALAGGGALAVSLIVGGLTSLGLGALYHAERRRLLIALVAQGDAGALTEVGEVARAMCGMSQRTRLAGSVRAAADVGRAGAVSSMMVDPARAADARERLLVLAAALEDPQLAVTAPAVALCRRLLSEAAGSPLYNPRLPGRELDRVLEFVARGIGSGEVQAVTVTVTPEPACSASSARSTSASSL
ncbi:MAG: hypothetical protein ACR2NR_16180 [Solirubrobacteraceae bacterium]